MHSPSNKIPPARPGRIYGQITGIQGVSIDTRLHIIVKVHICHIWLQIMGVIKSYLASIRLI